MKIDSRAEIDISSIRPIRDYVLMESIEQSRSVGGIHLMGNQNECSIGKVVAVGSHVENPRGTQDFPMDISPGDVVLTMDYMGEKIEMRMGQYRMIRTHGIWAKLKMRDATSHDIAEIEPRMTCVVVELADEKRTRDGIYLPNEQDSKAANRWATVLKVGPGAWSPESGERVPLEVREGDEVLMMRYAGANLTVNGKLVRIIEQGDIRFVKERA